MSKSEFLLLIPGLIYGVGLVELMRILNRKMYWEIIAWSLVMFFSLIVQWFGLYDRLEFLTLDIGIFTLLLINPLLFTRTCHSLTPNEDVVDTEMYFKNERPLFFVLLALSLTSSLVLQYILLDDGLGKFRIIGLPLVIACIFIHEKWIRVVAFLFFLAMGAFIFVSGYS